MKRKTIGIAVLLAAATAAILWASGRVKNPFLPFLALGLFFLGTNFFGKVSELAERMRPLLGRKVQVQVWGSALSEGNGGSFVLHAVRALGAGLHVYLRPTAGGSPRHLKVAQPIGATTSDECVEVQEAKYVQWDGRMIKKVTGVKALVLNLER
jgi:hypothetical protein